MKDKDGRLISTMQTRNNVYCIHCGRKLGQTRMTKAYSTCQAYGLSDCTKRSK